MNKLQKILQKYFGFGLYGLVRFKRGIRLSTSITFRCNYYCNYCNMTIPSGKWPKSEEKTIREWMNFLKTFPLKIKEVNVSGGEPTLIKGLPGHINWMLKKGYFVTLYTNLTNPKVINRINPSFRFRVLTTYHHHAEKEQFEKTYRVLSEKYRVDIDEIGKKYLKDSKLKLFDSKKTMANSIYKRLRAAPDLQIFPDCYTMYSCEKYIN